MKILALDIAAATGWAISTDDKVTGHGVEVFSAKDPFKRAFHMQQWLKGGILKTKIDHVYVEQYYPGKITNFNVVRGLIALHTAVGVVCHELNVPYDDVAIASWRNHFIGTTKAPKSVTKPADRTKWLKKAVLDKCQERGFENVSDDNEADALGIMDFILCNKFPNYGTNTTPLFARV